MCRDCQDQQVILEENILGVSIFRPCPTCFNFEEAWARFEKLEAQLLGQLANLSLEKVIDKASDYTE